MKKEILWCLAELAIVGFFGWKTVQQIVVLVRMNLAYSQLGSHWGTLAVIFVSGVTCVVFVGFLIRRILRILTDIRINRENH